GKEADAEAFLKSAQPLALDEKGTLKWYAIKIGAGKFGIFDTFANEAGRNAHLTGEIAKALGARASELFAIPPQVQKVEVLANTAKTAIVTGASRGIGAGLVEAFLKRGYSVVANSRHITKANPFPADASVALVDGDIGDPRTAA